MDNTMLDRFIPTYDLVTSPEYESEFTRVNRCMPHSCSCCFPERLKAGREMAAAIQGFCRKT